MKCVYNYCVQRCDIYAPIPSACRFWNVTKSATNRYQSISIYLSIVIENRYKSITTRIFAIDCSSIININRLTDIDWYWLISIIIDYRFHRLDTPGTHQSTPSLRICRKYLLDLDTKSPLPAIFSTIWCLTGKDASVGWKSFPLKVWSSAWRWSRYFMSFSACRHLDMLSVRISSQMFRLELKRIFLSAFTSSIASWAGKLLLKSFW